MLLCFPSQGTVIDSGDGVTHVIPVAEGYVIGSSIKHIPLAGRDITQFVNNMLRDREKTIPPEQALQMAQRIKEEHCYVCSDVAKEMQKFDADATKFKQFSGDDKKKNTKWTVDVGYEQFLGPEIFFNPEIFSNDFSKPLSEVVDHTIQSCPIDTRRGLYKNIVLSGGSTMFKHFDKRLERDIKQIVDNRLKKSMELTKAKIQPKPIDVNVLSFRPQQRYAVWFGGSMLALASDFFKQCHTKKDYEEKGPAVARHSPIFQALTL